MPERVEHANDSTADEKQTLCQQKDSQVEQAGIENPYSNTPLRQFIALFNLAFEALGGGFQEPDHTEILDMSQIRDEHQQQRRSGQCFKPQSWEPPASQNNEDDYAQHGKNIARTEPPQLLDIFLESGVHFHTTFISNFGA